MKYCNVTEHLFQVIRTLEEKQRKSVEYSDGIVLAHGEMRFLQTVARYPDENVSALSLRLGITKGAVTQMAAKLAHKELLQREQRDGNRQKTYVRATERGAKIIEQHHRRHQQANETLCRFITGLDDGEARSVFRFLECLAACAPFSQFPCLCAAANDQEKEVSEHEATIALCARPACRP